MSRLLLLATLITLTFASDQCGFHAAHDEGSCEHEHQHHHSHQEGPSYQSKAVIRKPAPSFRAMAWDVDQFREISLEDYRGQYVVLFFYPLDFTFVCPTEICQFNDMLSEFEKINTAVIGCSVDSHFSHREYSLKKREDGGLGQLQIPLISDLNKQIAKDYGCYLDFSEDAGVSLRATYIIDESGILRHMSINDLPVGRNVHEILRLVQGFQHADTYGEVCPASWNPGAATMVPDHESDQLQDYWKKHHKAE